MAVESPEIVVLESAMRRVSGDEKPKLQRRQYEKELRTLQVELCHLHVIFLILNAGNVRPSY